MTRHVATWASAIALALLLAYAGPDDAAEVVAADVSDAIQTAKAASKEMK